METQDGTVGFVQVRAEAAITEHETELVVDFGPEDSGVELELNGRLLRANDLQDLATLIATRGRNGADGLISIPYEVAVESGRLVISTQPPSPMSERGAHLRGAQAQEAVDKASRILESGIDVWPAAPTNAAADVPDLDGLSGRSRWDGPLVVSMPRTGSTLMGILFLFYGDSASRDGYRFRRYIHEPAAPVFWRGDDIGSIAKFVDPPLSNRDVVQESAYQFAFPELAKWFLSQARPPVIFTMRHPGLAWPSRWRAMLAKALAEQPDPAHQEAMSAALRDDDFSALGGYLTEQVRPADNGFFSFAALLNICVDEGLEFVIIDNTRFRDHPESTLRELCHRLDVEFDEAMTNWTSLEPVLPRVVMSDLALGDEYEWYYSGTLGSSRGIRPETHIPVDPERFPPELRGVSDQHLTIHEAVTWYELLLSRPETLL